MTRKGGVITAAVAFAVIAVAQLTRSLLGLEALGGASAVALTAVSAVAGVAAIVGVAIAIVAWKQRGLSAARAELQRRLPAATLRRVYGESDFALGVSLLARRERRPTANAFLLLAVHPDRIEFWDADTTAPLVELEPAHVVDVECRMATGEGTVSRATVFLAVHSELLDRRVFLPFVIMRDTGPTFLPEGLEVAERVAHDVASVRGERAR